ncbi:5-bromo-4-chloroindolyl phosphate hydrolysis family protein [Adlercreutzia sp. ZJ141]|uniref:5-bromo-4-chloroindolyl phosphate hydrolysis family protein n=1 Tax=Adlercreutzia sp. ZJ141 TaxID=2709406 RepID=UPI0013EAFBF3|nr:5-bromo-4-chloroindolyl phosphate hydrolysis family protein [Adlercreutzia sp. ZJ141]
MSQHNSYKDWNSKANSTNASRGAQTGMPKRDMSAQDFEKMCRSIEQSVSQVVKLVGTGIDAANVAAGHVANEWQRARQQTTQQPLKPQKPQQARPVSQPPQPPRPQQLWQAQAMANPKAYGTDRFARMKNRFRSTAGLTATGVLMTVFGGSLTVTFTVALIVMLVTLPVVGMSGAVAVPALFATFAALSAGLLAVGIRRLRSSQRVKAFRRIFGEREVCSISELAAQLHVSESKVLGMARRLLKLGMLPQGHIDDEETCLMLTDESYELYRQMQRARTQQLEQERQQKLSAQQEERIRAQEARTRGELPPDARAFIEEGNAAVENLRTLDARIADAEVSEKIVAIEEVVGRILARVAEEPSVVGGIGRLTSYYLPTTVKLLEAYDSLEDQPVQGANIASSRQEIEQTLDVLRTAFEKLLDETFQDLSLDVSSDISVLNAMLAQEGLTHDPFKK